MTFKMLGLWATTIFFEEFSSNEELKFDFRDFYQTRNNSWTRNSNNSTRNTCFPSRNAQPFSQEYLRLQGIFVEVQEYYI